MANSTDAHCVFVDPRPDQPCSVDETEYGYIPVLSAGVVFVILFSLMSMVLVPQGFIRWPRGRFMIPTAICAVAEIVGWAFRVQGHYRPFISYSYIAQITILIIAPVFLSASNYIGLDHIMSCVGYEFARFRKRVYLSTFLTLDILSLVVQAIGGGSAGSSSSSSSGDGGKTGMYIALGGVALQVLATILYLMLLLDFLRRHYRNYRREENLHLENESIDVLAPGAVPSQSRGQSSQGTVLLDGSESRHLLSYGRWTKGTRQYCAAVLFASLCLLVRCVYRAAEMSGFNNAYLFNHEWYLCVFDGVPIFLALLVLSIYHPSRTLPAPWAERQYGPDEEKYQP